MKMIFTMLIMMSSVSSYAVWNELECDVQVDGKSIRVEVEESFPRGSYFKRAQLVVTENDVEETFDYTVSSRRSNGFNQIRYIGAGLDLEVDFWPDQRPQWGRTYRGTLRSAVFDNQSIQGLSCRFPNIQ
jgi:hypothetical protein